MSINNDVVSRFLARINFTPTCWMWTGTTTSSGYSRISVNGKTTEAYKVAYEIFIGPVPRGLELDHLCRVHGCVNPNHLEAVTHKENIQRGDTGLHNLSKTHCPQGHRYTESNTRVYRGSRTCRMCNNHRPHPKRHSEVSS